MERGSTASPTVWLADVRVGYWVGQLRTRKRTTSDSAYKVGVALELGGYLTRSRRNQAHMDIAPLPDQAHCLSQVTVI